MFRECWVMFIINGSITFERSRSLKSLLHSTHQSSSVDTEVGRRLCCCGVRQISVRSQWTSCPTFLLLTLWAVCPHCEYFTSNSASVLKLPRCEVVLLWILVTTQVVLTFLPFTPSPVFVFPSRLPIARAPSFLGLENKIRESGLSLWVWGPRESLTLTKFVNFWILLNIIHRLSTI